MFNIKKKEINLADGRVITLETGRMARQADGAVLLTIGKTMLLATVVSAKEAKEDTDFMPLSVEYKEKYASSGRFPGGFLKREARPSDYEILISRLVDRALRPLFPDNYHAETFVTINLISADIDTMPDALAGLAASAALAVSDIPFNGPISEVRVARIDNQFVVNPPASRLKDADIDLLVGATYDNILMVEGEMKEVSEEEMLEALRLAHETIKIHCKAQMEFAQEAGKTVKRGYDHEVNDEEMRKKVWDETYAKCYEAAKSNVDKHSRQDKFESIINEFIAQFPEDAEINEAIIKRYYHDVQKEAARRLVLDENTRLDGRNPEQIRPIVCEVDLLPATHGSAFFTRGETQSLTTVTLGTKLDEKIIDDVLNQGTEKFTLHYNFPPFATGEAKAARGLSRREIGHGNLAHRALKSMMPADEENPYAVRVVSDILESNGSSSMATVCAGTLALMDSGIKLKKPVSGIAMGLIKDTKSDKYVILSDILGDEDHLGDMDFKVAGTRDGITATQMDIKVEGLSFEILTKALAQAKAGRMHILGIMNQTLSEPRPDLKPHAPRIVMMSIPKEMIGALIGPGGKVIQEIQRETGATIIVEEVDGRGDVNVFGENETIITAAVDWIKRIVAVPEIGEVYRGKVKTIVQFGAFVEILPNKDGLLHISEIDWKKVAKVEDVLKEGQEVEVKIIDIEQKTGKIKLSRKVLLPRPPKEEHETKNPEEHERKHPEDQERRHHHNPHQDHRRENRE
ncbi:MAG TPA: polyribonucleotide nucleotidyltransferase [Bacteroidales bacterium]|nr:polyribonucleotide nucleotidyltransferase [Bacteroidales bacterium]